MQHLVQLVLVSTPFKTPCSVPAEFAQWRLVGPDVGSLYHPSIQDNLAAYVRAPLTTEQPESRGADHDTRGAAWQIFNENVLQPHQIAEPSTIEHASTALREPVQSYPQLSFPQVPEEFRRSSVGLNADDGFFSHTEPLAAVGQGSRSATWEGPSNLGSPCDDAVVTMGRLMHCLSNLRTAPQRPETATRVPSYSSGLNGLDDAGMSGDLAQRLRRTRRPTGSCTLVREVPFIRNALASHYEPTRLQTHCDAENICAPSPEALPNEAPQSFEDNVEDGRHGQLDPHLLSEAFFRENAMLSTASVALRSVGSRALQLPDQAVSGLDPPEPYRQQHSLDSPHGRIIMNGASIPARVGEMDRAFHASRQGSCEEPLCTESSSQFVAVINSNIPVGRFNGNEQSSDSAWGF